MEVLPDWVNVHSGPAESLFTGAELYPSTNWEETFPRRNVTTTLVWTHHGPKTGFTPKPGRADEF